LRNVVGAAGGKDGTDGKGQYKMFHAYIFRCKCIETKALGGTNFCEGGHKKAPSLDGALF
jgi:hypothetical protein